MDTNLVRRLLDETVRANPVPATGVTVQRLDSLVRLTGPFNFISWWTLTDDTVEAAVRAQAADVRSRGQSLIWRVYDHDRPQSLPDHLRKAGFDPVGVETVMVFDLAHDLQLGARDSAVSVRRVRALAELDDFITVSAAAFGHNDQAWRRDAGEAQLSSADLMLVLAQHDGVAAGSARLEIMDGCPFGLLLGGGVAPAHRGRGLYQAMVAARADEARRRGLTYLVTDAGAESRPLLERMGFVPIAQGTTWVLAA